MEEPQSSVAQMIGRMLRQSHTRIEQASFDPTTEPATIQRYIASASELNDAVLQGHGHLVLGQCQWYSGQPQAAVNSFQLAGGLYRQGKSYSNVLVALAQCADIYRIMGDQSSAFELLKEGEAIVNEHAVSNHMGSISLLYSTRGALWLDAANYDAAANDFDQVFKVHERQSQDHAFAANQAWRGIAEIHLHRNQFGTAWSISRLARESAERSNSHAQRYAAYSLGARLAMHDPDQPYSVQEFFDAATQTLYAIGLVALQAIVLIQEARHFTRLGDGETASGLLEQASTIIDDSISTDLHELVGWMRSQLEN